MTSNLSSSPVDNIYSPGGRCSAVGLDTLCTVSSTRADTASTVAAATANDCRSGLSSPAAGYCRSPDANSGITPGDFMQSISANSAAAIEAAALRLMLGGRNHLGHHQLPVLGVGPSSMAIGAGQASISHRQHHPMDSSAFYLPPNIQLAAEMASPDSNWAGLVYGSSVGLSPYDQRAATDYQSYLHCYGGIHDVRRKNATRESTSTLKSWLIQHIKNPYPTKGEKIMLAIITKMTLTQVSTWFANARRRLKKENKMQWSPRQRTGDDDDDDADDDVMNGSFSVSDDECSDDIIVDDREFNSSVAPRRSSQSPRLSSSADMSSLDHYANDRHHQHQQQQHRLHMTSSLSQRHAITTDVNHVTAHSVKSERDRNNSPTFGEEDAIGGDSEHDDVTSGNQHHHHHQHQATAASKPRIWSIAELATSGDKRRNSSSSSGSTTTITPTTSSVCDQTMLTSPSSLPSPGLPRHRESTPDADFRHQWNAANAGSEDAIHAFLRRQFSERMTPQSLPTTSISAGEHGVFPAAAVEALRWQMAAAACRAASAAVAAASSNRAAAAHRFDGSVPNVTTDSAGTRAVSALR